MTNELNQREDQTSRGERRDALAQITKRPEWAGLEGALRKALQVQGKQLELADKGGALWCLCPGHDDHNPSLSLWVNDLTGALWFKCHAGCSSSHVLDRLGLKASEVQGQAAGLGGRKVVTTYNYVSALSGEVVYRKRRFKPKGFDLQHTLDRSRTWLKGRGPGGRLLYRLDLIAGARSEGRPVWLCEGEKDADVAWREYGAVGTTNDDGATGFKEEDATALINVAEVVVVPDRDAAGAKRLRQVWELMRKVAPGVVVRLLTVPPPYKDLTELHEAGFGQAEVTALISERGIVEHDVAEFERVANDKLLELKERYVYCAEIDRFIDIVTRVRYQDKQLNSLWASRGFPLSTKGSIPAAATFLNAAGGDILEGGRTVDKVTYWPGKERYLQEDDQSAVNLWRPSKLRPVEGDASWWLEHLTYLIPKERERDALLNWCAWLVQRPGEKPNVAIFMGGVGGIGKDTLFEPLFRCLGQHNVKAISSEILREKHNGWLLDTQVVVVEEIKTLTKKEIKEKLKPVIAAPPPMLDIRLMNRDLIHIPNRVSMVAFSNDQHALALDDERDRRYLILWSEAKPRPQEYYDRLWEKIEDEAACGAVYHWLLTRDLTGYNPKASGLMTKAKTQMAEASKTTLQRWLESALEELEAPFHRKLFTTQDVMDGIPEEVTRAFHFPINETAVGRLLGNCPELVKIDMRADVITRQDASRVRDETTSINQLRKEKRIKRIKLWCRTGHQAEYDELNAMDLGQAYLEELKNDPTLLEMFEQNLVAKGKLKVRLNINDEENE